MIDRILPHSADHYWGMRAGLWLLGGFIALKLLMSVNSILNARDIMTGVDGIPLGTMDPGTAETALFLFRSLNLGQLTLTLFSLVVLVRYRALVPLIYALLLFDHLARRMLSMTNPIPRTDTGSGGLVINLAILGLLLIGFACSLTRRSGQRPD